MPDQSNSASVRLSEAFLQTAEMYTRQLDLERLSAQRDLTDAEVSDLVAAQGFALRRTLYKCTEAIVAAIREGVSV